MTDNELYNDWKENRKYVLSKLDELGEELSDNKDEVNDRFDKVDEQLDDIENDIKKLTLAFHKYETEDARHKGGISVVAAGVLFLVPTVISIISLFVKNS